MRRRVPWGYFLVIIIIYTFIFQNVLRWCLDRIRAAQKMNHSFLSRSFFSSVHSVTSDCLRPHGLQHTRPSCPSPTPRAYSDSCPLSWWCHPTILSSVAPFSSCSQFFPASGSFPMSQLFGSGGQTTGASTSISVLPVNIQG